MPAIIPTGAAARIDIPIGKTKRSSTKIVDTHVRVISDDLRKYPI
jgi:hypothetical protein